MATPALWSLDLCDGAGVKLVTLSRASGLSLTFTRNGVPEATFSLAHEDDDCATLLAAYKNGTGGGVPTLKGYRKGTGGTTVLRFNGYLAVVSEESGVDASTATFTFRGPFGRLLGDGNNAGRFTAPSVSFAATDAGQIAKALIDTANTAGTTGIATSGAIQTSKSRDRTYQSANVGQIITDLTNVLDGFDFEVLPATAGSFNATQDIVRPALSAPTNLVTAPGGPAGTGSGGAYVVTAIDGLGGETTVSNEATSSFWPVTLTWNAVTGAVAYRVYRSFASGGEFTSPAFIAQTGSLSYTDGGGGANPGAAPTTNTTGGVTSLITTLALQQTLGLLEVYASQGSNRPGAKFEYGPATLANCSAMHRQTLPPVNAVTVIGANGLSSTKTDATSLNKYGRWEYQETQTDVTDQATLDDKANALLRPNPVKTLDFTPEPRLAPSPWDDYWIGDTVYFYANRGALLEGPIGVRVNQITVAIDPDTGYETSEIPNPETPDEASTIRAGLQTEVVS